MAECGHWTETRRSKLRPLTSPGGRVNGNAMCTPSYRRRASVTSRRQADTTLDSMRGEDICDFLWPSPSMLCWRRAI